MRDAAERVAIVDIDAHHGNGTQEIFYEDPDVLYVSFHEWPLYPGHGAARRDRRPGRVRGPPATCRSLPARPATSTSGGWTTWSSRARGVRPTWLLISAGYDATATTRSPASASRRPTTRRSRSGWSRRRPAGRVVTFLEGGYSLAGLRDSVAASIPVLAGGTGPVPEGEGPTSGGPGDRVVNAVGELWRQRRAG